MAVNLINSNDINITQTGNDIALGLTSSAVANKNVYSTTETRIGEWNGKPLYRKVIILLTPISITANTWTTITSLSNIKDITNYFAILSYDISGSYLCRMDNGNFQVYFKDTLSIKAATIEYTKTTD